MSETHFIRRRWKLILNLVTLGALFGLIFILRHQLAETVENLHHVNLLILLLIIPMELWNYDCYARMYRTFFRILGTEVSYRDMFKVTLELNMVNHIFPTGGVSGFSYFSLRLKHFGISTGKSTLVQTMRFIFLFITYEILLVIGLLFLAAGGRANNLTILVAGSIATALVIATLGAAFIIESERRINNFFSSLTRILNRVIHIVRPKHPNTIDVSRVERTFTELHENYKLLKSNLSLLKEPLTSAFFANLTELLAVFVVYVAFGHWINPGALILAYAVANFAGLISVLPGGIGIYEALMTAVLVGAGVPAAISLPVTVMYRVVNMLIQIVPGYYFYHKALHTEPNEAQKIDTRN